MNIGYLNEWIGGLQIGVDCTLSNWPSFRSQFQKNLTSVVKHLRWRLSKTETYLMHDQLAAAKLSARDSNPADITPLSPGAVAGNVIAGTAVTTIFVAVV